MNFIPAFLRARLRVSLLCPLIVALTSPAAAAADVAQLAEALAHFNTEPPRGWAYTMTTTRDGQTTVERFDPSRPTAGQWKLVSRNGTAPTADEIEQYRRYKATVASPGVRATFSRGDIDTGNAQVVRDTATETEYLCRFRQDLSDAMLSRLALTLVVEKNAQRVSSFHFRLIQPFSPALGVKMQQLDVRMSFSPAGGGLPALPQTASSRFKGRVLFLKSVEENLEIAYSDFTPPGEQT